MGEGGSASESGSSSDNPDWKNLELDGRSEGRVTVGKWFGAGISKALPGVMGVGDKRWAAISVPDLGGKRGALRDKIFSGQLCQEVKRIGGGGDGRSFLAGITGRGGSINSGRWGLVR